MHRYSRWPIHLALSIVCALMLVPFLWVLKTSLTGENIFVYPPSILPEDPHLFYYVEVWYSIPFFRYLVNSVFVSAIVVVANVFLNAMAGYALTRDFLGKRTIMPHISAFEDLGFVRGKLNGGISMKAGKYNGADMTLSEISVTATENAVMAAVLAPGKTIIRLAAAEPHVQDLCKFLNSMGAKIKGIGTHELQIEGVRSLKGTEYSSGLVLSPFLRS